MPLLRELPLRFWPVEAVTASCWTCVHWTEQEQIDDCWAVAIMADELFDDSRIRVLAIVDRSLVSWPHPIETIFLNRRHCPKVVG